VSDTYVSFLGLTNVPRAPITDLDIECTTVMLLPFPAQTEKASKARHAD